MLKKLLALAIISSGLVACASWFSSSSESAPAGDNPAVGSKDSSDFLFGQAASAPVASAPKAVSAPKIASEPASASAAM